MTTQQSTLQFKPPKPYHLKKVETLATFEAWKHNQLYNIRADPVYKAFLAANSTWRKAGRVVNCGMVDDAPEAANSQSAAEKCEVLTMILEGIANWCPHISRTFIVKQTPH